MLNKVSSKENDSILAEVMTRVHLASIIDSLATTARALDLVHAPELMMCKPDYAHWLTFGAPNTAVLTGILPRTPSKEPSDRLCMKSSLGPHLKCATLSVVQNYIKPMLPVEMRAWQAQKWASRMTAPIPNRLRSAY